MTEQCELLDYDGCTVVMWENLIVRRVTPKTSDMISDFQWFRRNFLLYNTCNFSVSLRLIQYSFSFEK